MASIADLEISLYQEHRETFTVEMRYNDPDDIQDRPVQRGQVSLDLASLERLALDPIQYGLKLAELLFADRGLHAYFAEARAVTGRGEKSLRIRLRFDPIPLELHRIRWETLHDPIDGSWLAISERILLSRYLSSSNWGTITLPSRKVLRSIVMVANPLDLAKQDYQVGDQILIPIDVSSELERARQSLLNTLLIEIASDSHNPGQATLERLIDALRQGCDLLYLVCHGALLHSKDGACLWFENADGTTNLLPGSTLVDRLQALSPDNRPRLIVLASCQSGGQGAARLRSVAGDAFTALGPQLAQAGVPAVVAMQGDISMETAQRFFPLFFKELLRDGQIDRAMAAGRASISDRPDAWMPVLYLRMREGHIWYRPGFSLERSAFEQWQGLIRSIQRQKCTPILGPAVNESLLGSGREMAAEWASKHHYPMRPQECDSLPQVAQYLAFNQYPNAPIDELEEYLNQRICSHYGGNLPPGFAPGEASLDDLLMTAGIQQRHKHPQDPYRLLAQLELPIYITTNYDNMLASALRDAGREPRVILCPWNDYILKNELYRVGEGDYIPTPGQPLVVHMFGRLNEPRSLVLTEDQYFDFLIGIARNKDLIPAQVRRAWAATSLLFLGFQMDDWTFRVLFRSIMAQAGGALLEDLPHIAVQIDPQASNVLEPGRARRYLENYFSKSARISLYWGSVEDFIQEFELQLPR